jgi:hypothetical protein
MELIANGEEGMVLKRKDAKYKCGARTAWESIKIKQEETLDVVITGFCDPTKEYKGDQGLDWQYWVIEQDHKEFRANESVWVERERWIGEHRAIRSPEFRTIPVTKAYYYGWKNAIEVSAFSNGVMTKIGTISSGLTDELRQAFADRPQNYMEKVVEVKCMSVDNKEKTIRHGYFLKFREDKNPEDCKFSLIFS